LATISTFTWCRLKSTIKISELADSRMNNGLLNKVAIKKHEKKILSV
jgi:hypothetical protein